MASRRKTKPGSDVRRSVLAVAAHPDDIEFTMAGTLLALQERGWDVHYLNIGNGCGGSHIDSPGVIAAKRLAEARASCRLAGFTHYPPFANDLEILYTTPQLAKVISVLRAANPSIVLCQSPQDYMEDHQNATRLAVTAAFCKGSKNAPCRPRRKEIIAPIVVYHGLPHGLRDGLGKRLRAGIWVDIKKYIAKKEAMLACHKSQKEWLDVSQGMDSYLKVMTSLAVAMGRMSGKYKFAEGWRRHNPLGYHPDPNADPLYDALADISVIDKKYLKWLEE